jgi:hypothetical protein
VKRRRQGVGADALPFLLFVFYFSIVAVDWDSGGSDLGFAHGPTLV